MFLYVAVSIAVDVVVTNNEKGKSVVIARLEYTPWISCVLSSVNVRSYAFVSLLSPSYGNESCCIYDADRCTVILHVNVNDVLVTRLSWPQLELRYTTVCTRTNSIIQYKNGNLTKNYVTCKLHVRLPKTMWGIRTFFKLYMCVYLCHKHSLSNSSQCVNACYHDQKGKIFCLVCFSVGPVLVVLLALCSRSNHLLLLYVSVYLLHGSLDCR